MSTSQITILLFYMSSVFGQNAITEQLLVLANSIFKWMMLRHIFQVFPDVTVKQQVHIINRGVYISQSSSLDSYIFLATSAPTKVQSKEITAIGIFDLHAGSIDIKRAILFCFFFLGPRGFDSGRLTKPFRKCVFLNLSKKTINPNPSPIGKNWFGLYWFAFRQHFRCDGIAKMEIYNPIYKNKICH